MALPPWRLDLQPASFKGAGFHVDVDTKSPGRRTVLHQFPKNDTPYAEDMGRRARHFAVAAYVISGPNTPDYRVERDALIAALESEGPGLLVHPTMGVDLVQVDGGFSVAEHRERGGEAEFQINFVEAGAAPSSAVSIDTQSAVTGAAQSAIQSFQQSQDIAGLGQ
jgi:prophage DNA circulation protein